MARKPIEYGIKFINEPNIDIITKAKADIIIKRVERLPIGTRDMAYDIILQEINERKTREETKAYEQV